MPQNKLLLFIKKKKKKKKKVKKAKEFTPPDGRYISCRIDRSEGRVYHWYSGLALFLLARTTASLQPPSQVGAHCCSSKDTLLN